MSSTVVAMTAAHDIPPPGFGIQPAQLSVDSAASSRPSPLKSKARSELGWESGVIMTGSNIQEYNGPNGIGRAGSGVVRKPGATGIYVTTEQKTVLKMADGRVVGFESSTKGRYVLATGAAALQHFSSAQRRGLGAQDVGALWDVIGTNADE